MKTIKPEIGKIKWMGKYYMDTGYSETPEVKLHYLIFSDKGPNGQVGFTGLTLELGLFLWSSN